jgi:hypothetical protein
MNYEGQCALSVDPNLYGFFHVGTCPKKLTSFFFFFFLGGVLLASLIDLCFLVSKLLLFEAEMRPVTSFHIERNLETLKTQCELGRGSR